jgi:hypothetical protein
MCNLKPDGSFYYQDEWPQSYWNEAHKSNYHYPVQDGPSDQKYTQTRPFQLAPEFSHQKGNPHYRVPGEKYPDWLDFVVVSQPEREEPGEAQDQCRCQE